MNVLIIEDAHMVRSAIGLHLLERKHMVTVASNGKEAVSHIEAGLAVNLIICDVMLPELSGPAFLLMLKRFFPVTLPHIIIISGVRDGESFVTKMDIPFNYYLPKPVDFNKLDFLIASMSEQPRAQAG